MRRSPIRHYADRAHRIAPARGCGPTTAADRLVGVASRRAAAGAMAVPAPRRPHAACRDRRRRSGRIPDAAVAPAARTTPDRCRPARPAPGQAPAASSTAAWGRGRGFGGRCAVSGIAVAAAELDEGLAAHLAQEAVVLVFQLAPTDRLADLAPAVLVAGRGLARRDALQDVPAGVALERRR